MDFNVYNDNMKGQGRLQNLMQDEILEGFVEKRNITSLSKLVDLSAMKLATLLNLSTTTMMESCCFNVLAKPVMKSMEINSHFPSGI